MDNIIKNENHDLTKPESASETDVPQPSPQTLADETLGDRASLNGAQPMQIRRFLFGLLIASTGVGLMLTVAMGVLHGWGVEGRFSLPVIALCMIIGLMFLGGGFGVMATSSATFDDDEFDRLMAGENRFNEAHQPPQAAEPFSQLQKEPVMLNRRAQDAERLLNSL